MDLRDDFTFGGWLEIEVTDENGNIKFYQIVKNLITDVGDQVYMERGGGVSGAPNAPTGMRLGTGTTAVSKTGAGAAIVTYQNNSALAFTTPAASSQPGGAGTARRITYTAAYSAGTVNGAALAEAVITNETLALTNGAGNAANTTSRALIGPFTLGSLDLLTINWRQDGLGS